ncbi:MAG: DNA polymerase III subunit beta [candidate division Zixibacteria bacterium]|nr:DNA polymerase III subunit beta [candidate division Zixibacteria bacterium]
MKFTILKSNLLTALQNIISVVPSRTTLPVLSHLLLEVEDSKIKLAATDLDISITITLPANTSKKGAITLPAKTFTEIVRESPETQIEVNSLENRVEIKINTGNYKLPVLPVEEFPKLPTVNLTKEIKIPGSDLYRMISKTLFAASMDETRPALNGVLWQTKGENIQMVATDGHRLAKFSKTNKILKGLHEDVIIPPKILNLLLRLTGEEDREIGVIFEQNSLVFNLGDTVLSTRLIEGPYPNFDQVIPVNNDKKMIVDKNLLASTVRRVSILSNLLTHQVKFSFKKDSLILSSANFDMGGEAKEKIVCDYKNEDMDIGYNALYVQDILKQIDGNEVIFELSSPVSAGLVSSAQKKEGEDYLCLIMPLRLVE